MEVNDSAAVVRHDQQDLENPDRRRWRREEVQGDDVWGVIVEKDRPTLRWWLATLRFVIGDRRQTDADAKLSELSELSELGVDSRFAPCWFRGPHVSDELAYLRIDLRSPTLRATLQSQIPSKACAMPLQDGG